MKSPILSRLRPFPLLISVIIVTLLSFFLFTILGIVTVVLTYGIPLQDVLSQFNPGGAENIGALKILQISQSIGIFIVCSPIRSTNAGELNVSKNISGMYK